MIWRRFPEKTFWKSCENLKRNRSLLFELHYLWSFHNQYVQKKFCSNDISTFTVFTTVVLDPNTIKDNLRCPIFLVELFRGIAFLLVIKKHLLRNPFYLYLLQYTVNAFKDPFFLCECVYILK